MPTINVTPETAAANPIDIVEQLVEYNDWIFDRRSDQEMAVQVPGSWCDYSLYFAWSQEMGAVHFTCAFDMRVPAERRGPIWELLAVANEKVWMGHFGMWEDEGLPMYRHAIPMRGAPSATFGQMEDLVENAIIECERFYPAFQYVIWGGKSARDAIESAMIETAGEA